MALNQSISLRQLDVVESFTFALVLYGTLVGGGVLTVVGLSVYYLIRALSAIREKTKRVASIAFQVPARVAKSMKDKTTRRLTKLANQLEEAEEDDDDEDRMDMLEDDVGLEGESVPMRNDHPYAKA